MKTAAEAHSCSEVTNVELARSVHLALCANRNGCSRIIVKVEEGTAWLSGPVCSFFLRQTAIALAKQVVGIRHVVDDLEVDWEGTRAH